MHTTWWKHSPHAVRSFWALLTLTLVALSSASAAQAATTPSRTPPPLDTLTRVSAGFGLRHNRFKAAAALSDAHSRLNLAGPLDSPRSQSGFAESARLTLASSEDWPTSAVIDPTGSFAYFGTNTAPGIVVKVRLSEFTRVGAVTLNAGENFLLSAAIDSTGSFAYFGTGTFPGMVVKVRLSDFTRVSALVLNTGEDTVTSASIDPVGTFAYFGTGTYPGVIIKVRLSDFTRVGALTANPGVQGLLSGMTDPTGSFAYFGTRTRPGTVVKVRLSDFTRVGTLTFNTGEDNVSTAVMDPAGTFAYFGTAPQVSSLTTPATVVKVRLSDFTRVGSLAFNQGEDNVSAAVIDPAGTFAYFGVSPSPLSPPDGSPHTPSAEPSGIVIKVQLSDMTRIGTLSLIESGIVSSGVIDPAGNYAYFGTATGPGTVVKVDLKASEVNLPIISVAK